ncbi:cold-shock protein [Novosphingobium lindaniclasticum]
MPSGRIKFFDAKKGYGFIAPDDGGPDLFVHVSVVIAAGIWNLEVGHAIKYDVLVARNGKVSAVNLRGISRG